MLQNFSAVWSTFGDIIGALPSDIVTVFSTIVIFVGVVGVLRSF